MVGQKPPWRARLGARILLGVILALGIGAVTAWVVAFMTGPAIFHDHMLKVETASPDPEVVAHAEEAFDHTWQLSLGLALLVACLTSIMVSAFLSRGITGPLARVRSAAKRVAAGDYNTRVPEDGMGAELAEMASAFNRMAAELAETELTRKRLLADLSHEMRTPVATVDGYLEGMLDGVTAVDAATLRMLRGQTERLRRLAEDISLVSAAEEQVSMQSAPIVLADLLREAAAQTDAAFAEQGVALSIDGAPEEIIVSGDRDRLAQVLTNLLDNALQHTKEGDIVTLRLWPSEEFAVLEVEDTGSGISTEDLPHLFERFYRVDSARDRAHGGSGIGLAIVRSIVEAHGGHVQVTSPGPTQGSTFILELPRLEQR